MKYTYEDLSSDQFETLVVCLCQQLFGIAMQGFAKGPDGGRDAKFVGTAERFPSTTAPWVGTTIAQAKHTNGYGKTFSDADFFSDKSSKTVIGKELPRIKKLRKSNELDHYILFANRRLSGNADSAIRTHIAQETTLPVSSIFLCGVEGLELWLKTFPDVVKHASIDHVEAPLIVSPDELAEVVEAFARNQPVIASALDSAPTPRVPYKDKNALNQMTEEYAREQRRKYLKYTTYIADFLSQPCNVTLRHHYEIAAAEFQAKVIAHREDFPSFDRVMEYLVDLLFNRDPVLRKNKPLTRAMLFNMYWNCDIGNEP